MSINARELNDFSRKDLLQRQTREPENAPARGLILRGVCSQRCTYSHQTVLARGRAPDGLVTEHLGNVGLARHSVRPGVTRPQHPRGDASSADDHRPTEFALATGSVHSTPLPWIATGVASMSTPTRATPFAIDDRAQTLSRIGLVTTGLVTTGLVTIGLVRKLTEHRTNLSIASDPPKTVEPQRWHTKQMGQRCGYAMPQQGSRLWTNASPISVSTLSWSWNDLHSLRDAIVAHRRSSRLRRPLGAPVVWSPISATSPAPSASATQWEPLQLLSAVPLRSRVCWQQRSRLRGAQLRDRTAGSLWNLVDDQG
jgi:hypothetical protein